ncbi:zinc finger, C3HC4 type (RING finger) domain containing protein [Acanthamoeba castellanii str. Neff]|uniref:Zinc finger, C3HC4 type (RING finger) domain containing protein n=1 Tax=Acanthamoeba castellanii (strain ATCC 30010 / Neff) TaxID=1257118 RepID=L8GV25_ACACF|nr:zinc finger, C3HC4 type (RING finger) domain containing protein [Acanthamoeba castellanii str. Neff]ELR17039.1 zinc finger, C3HC4 type (RING finger) domain containing protein [Acanthamoeba castellanii str. Neff]
MSKDKGAYHKLDSMEMDKNTSPSAPYINAWDVVEDDGRDDSRLLISKSDKKGVATSSSASGLREGAECRFCHEGEGVGGHDLAPDHLIGPCQCRGSVMWVHRGCLDRWRAVSTNSTSFSRCDLCHADYQMDYRAEGASVCEGLKVASWITLDFTLFILAVNAAAALCSLLVWAVDRDRQRDRIFSEAMHVSVPPALVVDWLFGWLAFFFVLGVLGLCYAIGRWCCGVSCDAGTCCYGPSYSPYYGHGDCYFYWCFVPDFSCHSTAHHHSSDCGSCGSCGGCGNCNMDCKGDGEALLIILAVVVILLILLGFFIGIGLAIMVGVKMVKRRMDVIHNKYKAGQWVVLDLTASP